MTKHLILSIVLMATSAGAIASPPNDTLAEREVITTTGAAAAYALGNNIGASGSFITSPTTRFIYSPVWYEWTSNSNSDVAIVVETNFDSVLSIYVSPIANPTSVADLILVGYDDDGGNGLGSFLTSSNPGAGTTYYIAVSGYGGSQGYFSIGIQQQLGELNDNFSNPYISKKTHFTLQGLNNQATSETGEPIHAGISNQKSIWIKWTANTRSTVTLDTLGSNYDTVLAVYTGTSLQTLTKIVSNDDNKTGFDPVLQSATRFTAERDQTYYIAVASKTGTTGKAVINLHATPRPPDVTLQPIAYVQKGTTTTIYAAANTSGTSTAKWQRKIYGQTTWSDIEANEIFSGQTLQTLTISSAPEILNNDEFRCIVTDENGSTTSRACKLQITDFPPIELTVGGVKTIDLSSNTPPPTGTTFYAKGYPKGFTFDPSTGVITAPNSTTATPGTYIITYGTISTDQSGRKTTSAPKSLVFIIAPLPQNLSGAFEAILRDETTALPIGKAELLVNSKTAALTGRITLLNDPTIYPLTGKIILNPTFDIATANITINRKKLGQPSYRLDVILDDSGQEPQRMMSLYQIDNLNQPTSTLGVSDQIAKIATYSVANPTPWASNYTLTLNNPNYAITNLGTLPIPEGTGFGTAAIPAYRGTLNFRGKLGDGTAITAALSPAEDATYRLFIKPYRMGGYFGGWLDFNLTDTPELSYKISLPSEAVLFWSKSPIAQDRAFRAGFGPISLSATAYKWVPTTPLRDKLLSPLDPGQISVDLSASTLSNDDKARLPLGLTMDPQNVIRVASPLPNLGGFTAVVRPSDGLVIARFRLIDGRAVVAEAVALQTPEHSSGTIITEGLFTIPPSTKGGESTTGRIRLTIPTP